MQFPDIRPFQKKKTEREKGSAGLSFPSTEDFQITKKERDAWMRDVQRAKVDDWFGRSQQFQSRVAAGQRERQGAEYVDGAKLGVSWRNDLEPTMTVLQKDARKMRDLLAQEDLFTDEEYELAAERLMRELGTYKGIRAEIDAERAHWSKYPDEAAWRKATQKPGMDEVPSNAVLRRMAEELAAAQEQSPTGWNPMIEARHALGAWGKGLDLPMAQVKQTVDRYAPYGGIKAYQERERLLGLDVTAEEGALSKKKSDRDALREQVGRANNAPYAIPAEVRAMEERTGGSHGAWGPDEPAFALGSYAKGTYQPIPAEVRAMEERAGGSHGAWGPDEPDVVFDTQAYYDALGRIETMDAEIGRAEQDITKAKRMQKAAGYRDLVNNPDFSEVTEQPAAGGEGGILRRYIEQDPEIMDFVTRDRLSGGTTMYAGYQKYDTMEPAERGVYKYLYATQGEEAAQDFLGAIDFDLNERQAALDAKETQAFARKHPVLSSAVSVLYTPAKVTGYLYSLHQYLKGQEIDPNSPHFAASVSQAVTRATVAGTIEKGVDSKLLGGALSFLYKTGMSVADFMTLNAAMGGLGVVGEASQLAIMGMGAAADTTRDVLLRGGTQQQAITAGTLAGVFEVLFEKISLDHFIGLKAPGARLALVKNLLAQSGIEASEELATGIANKLTDYYVMGGLSEYSQSVERHMAGGMTEGEAKARAWGEAAGELALDALGGALSGGMVGTFGSIGGMINTAQMGRELRTGGTDTQTLFQSGLSNPLETLAYQMAAENQAKQNAGGKVSNLSLGRQQMANELAEMGGPDAYASPRRIGRTLAERGLTAQTIAEGAQYEGMAAARLARQNQTKLDAGKGVGNAYLGRQHIANIKAAAEKMASDVRAELQAQGVAKGPAKAWSEIFQKIAMGTRLNGAEATAILRGDEARAIFEARVGELASDATAKDVVQAAFAARDGFHRAAQTTPERAQEAQQRTGEGAAKRQIMLQDQTITFRDSGAQGVVRSLHDVLGDGDVLVELSDGSIANAKDIDFADETADALYRAARDYTKRGAQAFLFGYDGSVPVETYRTAFLNVYRAGQAGISMADVMEAGGEFARVLSPAVLKQAYEAGTAARTDTTRETRETMNETQEFTDKARESANEPPQTENKTRQEAKPQESEESPEKSESTLTDQKKGRGGVIRKDTRGKLSRGMQSQVDVLEALGRKLGVWFVLEDALPRMVEIDGEPVLRNANGMYRTGSNEIHIAMDAVDGGLLYVGAHELLHFVRAFSEDSYQALRQFVLDIVQGTDAGYDLEGRIEAVLEAQPRLTRDGAIEEIIADAVPAVFADEKYVRQLVEQDRTLAEKIRDFFRDFVNQVRDVLSRIAGRNRPEMAALMRDAEALGMVVEAFDAALEAAAEGLASSGIRFGDVTKYSAEMQDTIREYREAVDENMLELAELYRRNRSAPSVTYRIAKATVREAADIQKQLGVDVTGFTHTIKKNTFEHIERRHGPKGVQDHSMQDLNDLARIAYVLKNYDKVEAILDEEGNPRLSSEFRDEKGNFAPMILYTKRINGTYFVVESVAATKAKMLPVISAYMSKAKDKGMRESDAEAPDITSETEAAPLSDVSVSNSEGKINDSAGDRKFSMPAPAGAEASFFAGRNSDKETAEAAKLLQREFTRLQAVGTPTLSRGDARKLAKKLLDGAKSAYDVDAMAEKLNAIFDRMAGQRNPDWYGAWAELHALAQAVVAQSGELDRTQYEEHADFVKYIRETGIALSGAQKVEAIRAYDGYENFRRKYFGRILLTERGKKLDSLWPEMAERWPDLLDADTVPADQPRALAEALEAIKPRYVAANQTMMDMAEMADDLALRIMESFMRETEAGKVDAEVQRLGRQARERMAAARERTVRRTSIERNSKALYRWLTRPTNEKHVPFFLKDIIADVLRHIDTSIRDGGRRGARWGEAMAKLQEELVNITMANSTDPAVAKLVEDDRYRSFYLTLHENLLPTLNQFVQGVRERGAIRLGDLNAQQLKDLDYIMAVIRGGVESVNRLYKNKLYEQASEVGDATITYAMSAKRKAERRKNAEAVGRFLNVDMLSAYDYFDRFGEAGASMADELSRGMEKAYARLREASEYMESVYKKHGIGPKDVRAWSESQKTVRLADGATVRMTDAQIMDLYALMKRGQARDHLFQGGIRLDRIDAKGKYIEQTAVHALTPEIAEGIVKLLTEKQRAVADDLQGFLSAEAAGWGNETSRELYLTDLYNERNYWPIRTVETTRAAQDPGNRGDRNQVKNSSFTKATTPGANGPIRLGDAFQSFTDHVAKMAAYNGIALPIDDAMRWFNYARPAGEDGQIDFNANVRTAIRNTLGEAGVAYFTNLVKDINGLSDGSYSTELSGLLAGKAKRAAIAGKIRVVIQQPTAYLRAMAMINPKYMLTVPKRGVSVAEMQRYAPIAWWKANGHFEVGIGRSTRSMLMGDLSQAERLVDMTMKPAGFADDITWATLWEAVKRETRDTRPDLKPGSDAYFEAVADRFSEIVNRTQVVDSILHRPQVLRSKDTGLKSLTAFMSEPIKTYNLLRTAVYRFRRNPGSAQARHGLAMAAVAVVSSNMLNALVVSMWDALKNREKDEELLDRYLKELAGNAVDNLNPLNWIPYANDIMSILQGYRPSQMEFNALSQVWYAAMGWWDLYQKGYSTKSAYALISRTVKAGSNFFGMPFSGILDNIEAILNAVTPGGIRMESDIASAEKTYQAIYDAKVAGDTKKAKSLMDWMQSGKQYGAKTLDDLDTGIGHALAENDSRVEAAARARFAGNTSEAKRIHDEIKAEGFNSNQVIKGMNWIETKYLREKTEKVTEYDDDDLSLFDYQHLEDMIRAGNAEGVTYIRDYMIGRGKEESDIRSAVTSRMKETYLASDTESQEKLGALLMDTLGYKADTLAGWIDPEPYKPLRDSVAAGDVTVINKEINALIEKGRSKAQVKSTVTEEAKTAYLKAFYAQDSPRMREIEKTLLALKGITAYKRADFAEWPKADIKKQVVDAIKAGDAETARKYSTEKERARVSLGDLWAAIQETIKPIYLGLKKKGDEKGTKKIRDAILAIGFSESRINLWK